MTTKNPNTPPTRWYIIVGTEGDDTLYGTDYADEIHGLGGNDYISGGFSNDLLYGDAGNDRLSGGGDNDYLDGGAGDDVLIGGSGADKILGGAGFDTASYENAWGTGIVIDLVTGSQTGDAAGDLFRGIERFVGSNYADSFYGTAGNNLFEGGGGNDLLNGREGNDTLNGGDGDDLLIGGAGGDTFIGGAGIDTVSYYAAVAQSEAITVDLTSGSRSGEAIGDTFSGTERLVGSRLGDLFNGDWTANIFEGGEGEDFLLGQAGNDTLSGGSGDDFIVGGSGADFIDGGTGEDRLTGDGPGWRGADTFVLGRPNRHVDFEADVITDFQRGFDKIKLRGVDYGPDGNPFGSDGRLSAGSSNSPGSVGAGDDLFYNTTSKQLFRVVTVFVDGQPSVDFRLLATIATHENNSSLSASDFIL